MPTCASRRLVDRLAWSTTTIGSCFRRSGNPSKPRLIDFARHADGSNTYAEILRRPEITYESLPIADRSLPDDVTQEVEIQIKYEGYIARDLEQIDRFRKLEDKLLPPWIDYEKISALRFESRQKLTRFRPDSIGQASRFPESPLRISLSCSFGSSDLASLVDAITCIVKY